MAKCGRCGTVVKPEGNATIMSCYNGAPDAHDGFKVVVGIKDNPWPPSDAQINYVLVLQAERVLPDDYKIKEDHELRTMDKSDVSGLIGTLKLFRRADSGKAQPQWTMPSGRYAVKMHNQDWGRKQWQFFLVDKPTEGKWKGYTFIKRLIGGAQDGGYRKVVMPAASREAALRAIEANPKEAMLDFGLQSGSCGHCGRSLSNAESLERGIGPICAGKMGW